LSAERRLHGASPEVDEEIRTLGERYGIPTEFTSYLVLEPQMRIRAANGGAAPAAMPVADARGQRFEAAKAASAQRMVSSVAAMDSMSLAAAPPMAERRDAAVSVRRVDARTFAMRDGVWIDQRHRAATPTTKIKAFSKAYFDLVAALPELRPAFALGTRVIVVGRTRAIELSDDGVETLSASAMSALVKEW
jgi:hypothetical protein